MAEVAIRLCSVADMANHAPALLREHWEEVAKLKHLFVLNPDWQAYEEFESSGLLLALAAWEGDKLVGYSANVIHKNRHYRDVAMCQNDVLFVASSHRGTSTGIRLMRETERMAKERGAQVVLWHAKPNSTLDRMLGREGSAYHVQDIIYAREV